MEWDRVDGRERRTVGNWNSHSPDEMQQRKLLFHVRILWSGVFRSAELGHFCAAAKLATLWLYHNYEEYTIIMQHRHIIKFSHSMLPLPLLSLHHEWVALTRRVRASHFGSSL
ncbi:hypothetical protein EVAR_42389_1 [Eumeta japonica]|uniref:Uncharacterized protein n=1 Tax=Eumeta variegata TaxID=151549 RepID=A0A4C1YG60_EUMVA|nr:hypothetical protein EVAR_42389_1 [Eumeta japonica]